MPTSNFSTLLARSAAVTCLTALTCLGLEAQQSSTAPSTLNRTVALTAPLDLSAASSASESSSSVAEERANLAGDDSSQPPPRRRYSRPKYSDRMHNADGSNKLTVAFGGGLALPSGSSSNIFTASYSIEGGIGYNFSKKLGLLAEVGYDHFGLQGNLIAQQQAYYNSLGIIDPTTGLAANFVGLDANAHMWSVTVDPIYTFYQGDKMGAYVIGGGGFYHKAINFTTPQQTVYYSYYGAIPAVQNANIDTHTANGGGFDFGGGVTFKPGKFNSVKLYAEARYVYADAKLTPEVKNPSPLSTLDSGSDSYVPITVGIRF